MYIKAVDPTNAMDGYHKVLEHLMDVESVGNLMVSGELISKDDLDAIVGAPSDYLRNSYLLEHVEQLGSSGVQKFFTLLQESTANINKYIGDHFLRSMLMAMCTCTYVCVATQQVLVYIIMFLWY